MNGDSNDRIEQLRNFIWRLALAMDTDPDRQKLLAGLIIGICRECRRIDIRLPYLQFMKVEDAAAWDLAFVTLAVEWPCEGRFFALDGRLAFDRPDFSHRFYLDTLIPVPELDRFVDHGLGLLVKTSGIPIQDGALPFAGPVEQWPLMHTALAGRKRGTYVEGVYVPHESERLLVIACRVASQLQLN